MAKQKHFRRGQAVYKCRGCGKGTRDVDGNGSVELCQLCDAKALCGNSLADSGYPNDKDPWAVFDHCQTVVEVEALLTDELEWLHRAATNTQ